MEAKLKALQCHFTWGIDKADIADLKSLFRELLNFKKSCHARYHPICFNILAFVSHLEGDSGVALGFLKKAEKVLRERKDDTELLVTYGNYAWVHYHAGNKDEVTVYLEKLQEIYKAHPKVSMNPCDLPIIHGEKGWSFLRLGVTFYQRARDSFQKAVEGMPDNVSFNVGYAFVLCRLEGLGRQRGAGGGEEAGDAIKQLRKALDRDPDNAEVMALLALKLQNQSTGRQEATRLVKQALRLAPDVPQVTRYVAKGLSKDNDLKTKLRQLECHFTWDLKKDHIDIRNLQIRLQNNIKQDLGRDAGVSRSYIFLAYVKYLQGYPEEAMEHMREAENLTRKKHRDCEKQLIVAYGDLAWLHYHNGDYTKSQGYLEKLEQIKEKFPVRSGCFHSEVYGEKGWTFLKFSRKNYHQALEYFQRALELQPEESEWNIGYAIALNRTEEKRSSPHDSLAIKQLRRALETRPENGELLALLAIQLSLYREFKEADELVEKALDMSPDDPNVMRYVSKYLRQRGDVDQSIDLLKRALDQTGQSAFIHHQMALCYKSKKIKMLTQQGSYRAKKGEVKRLRCLVIEHLRKATSLKSFFICAMAELALHYGEDGQHTRAEDLFKTTLETSIEKQEPAQIVHTFYAQFLQYQAKCEPRAIEHYTMGLQLDKDSREGKVCAARLRKIAEARVARDPCDGEACGLLGLVYKIQEENSQAVEWYKKALELDMENEDYLSVLFELHINLQEQTV
ncbi:interferon-induced protein with tetratricopeptide repeats 5-like [Osmerus mordax]|uniref:interferon-induced protein with tetratricopeptide repeats 5-like n=1 Tax=Osmerus mordax TaxID=8014 RepID=UPI00350F282F